jgi:hypothetical protein
MNWRRVGVFMSSKMKATGAAELAIPWGTTPAT